ncbi:MAG: restriction endonuclease subunit S [Candidatus Sumerlaeia bacterium]|nr:restriction endonuclease subunit S [Candidatus Sumerlaeia bacterium]
MNLSQIADIQIGYQSRRRTGDAPSTGDLCRVIQIKDFDAEGNLIPDSLVTVRLDTRADRYLVREGDVLFVSRGLRLAAAPVLENLPDTIVSSYLFRIRLTSDLVDPAYLAWCLNHTPGQQFLQSGARQGSNMPYVARGNLAEFPVPIPPLEVQRRIVEVDRLRQEENRLTRRLRQLRFTLTEHFSMALLARHSVSS